MIITGYHGTDLSCAENIVKDNFSFRRNKTHWLGNGVYFYLDYSLAEWWTTNPSSVFSIKIEHPSIIEATIQCLDDEILNLQKLSDYQEFIGIYYDEFLPLVYKGALSVNLRSSKAVRCAFCDYLAGQYNLKVLIGNFYLPHQPYLPDSYEKFMNRFSLSYIETQICVFDTNCISDRIIKMR